MSRRKTTRFAVGALVLAAALAGCGGGEEDMGNMPGMSGNPSAPPAAQQGDVNQADVMFARQMIPHHQQAVEMAKLVPSRTSNSDVVKLAEEIEHAQDPEIQTMTGWLEQWGAPAPTTGMDGGMDHGGMDGEMPGMMSPEDMEKLEQAKDAEFDRMWMQMMIEHHRGAIDMAETELKQGSNTEAKQLAQQIIDAQQAEITTMNRLLGEN
ncbi:MAG: DUF305 domain-containing protein [Haloechinothrix sp.]